MGKVSPRDRETKGSKLRKRTSTAKNKYLKPAALAQIRYSKTSTSVKSCTDLGKKRIAVKDADEKVESDDFVVENKIIEMSPMTLSPERFGFGPVVGPIDLFKQNNLQRTPRTPRALECITESRLESLPMDLLVKILCHLHHDQLRAVFHVSQRIRKAVLLAKQFHFNYTTPDRSRQEMLCKMTPLPTEHWPFLSEGDRRDMWLPSPHTPKAPRQGPRPPTRLNFTEMRQIAAVLFQESAFPSRCIVPSFPKPLCKSLASNRVLFYEDELCQAVAQNKLH